MKTNPSLKIFLTCVVISFLSFSLVFADSTDASTDAAATLNLRLKRLLNYVSWVWIWLSKIAGWCLGNSAVFGEFFGLDGVLWNLRNIMKNIANFGIGFLFLFKIIKTLFKAEEAFSFSFFKSFLVSGVLIQISRFFCATMIDISTVSIAGIGGLSTQLLNQDDVLSRSFEQSTLYQNMFDENGNVKKVIQYQTNDHGEKEITWVDVLKNNKIVKKELTEKEILDSFLPSRDNFSGPLTFIGLSLYDIQNSKFDNKYGVNNADTQKNFTTLINLMFNGVLGILCYTITLFFMVIIAFLRIFLLWMFIILSPLLILINQFEKELSGIGESIKMFSIKNFFKLVFRPVIVCLGLSILEFISASIDNIVPKSGSITLNELSCDNDSCTVGDIFDFHVLGLSSPLWQVFFSIIKIIILRKIIKMSITFETGFQTIDNITKKGTDLIENYVWNSPIIPLGQHGISARSLYDKVAGPNGIINERQDSIQKDTQRSSEAIARTFDKLVGNPVNFARSEINRGHNAWEYASILRGYEDNQSNEKSSIKLTDYELSSHIKEWLKAVIDDKKHQNQYILENYNKWKENKKDRTPEKFWEYLCDKDSKETSGNILESTRNEIKTQRGFTQDKRRESSTTPYHK